jgi:CRP-like cAMP-binding protein
VPEQPHEWSREEVIALLQRVDLFEGLPEGDLTSIAAIVGGQTVQPDECLFEEGEPGDAFYIVFRGAVEISKTRADGTEEKLAVRRKGDGFGEMALLNDAPRSATARATEETQLVSVSRDDFQQLLGGDSLVLRMMRALSKALRALSIRFANTEKAQDAAGKAPTDEFAVSRAMQAGFLPQTAPRVPGHDVAAGTTTEQDGRGASVWDWLELEDGRTALLSISVTQDGFPPAHHLGTSRAVVRAVAAKTSSVAELLRGSNEALASAGVSGLDQFIQHGCLGRGWRGPGMGKRRKGSRVYHSARR